LIAPRRATAAETIDRLKRGSAEALADWTVRELVRAGAASVRDGMLENA
jgi:hypothetical protein